MSLQKRITFCIISFIAILTLATPCIAVTDDAVLFTGGEREYIASARPVTVGVIEGRYPFSDIDPKTGKITGIFVDLCELIAQKSGLKFNYALVPMGVRAVDWLDSGKGQFVAGVFYSEFNMPNERLIHTDTLFSDSFVVIGRKGEKFSANAAIRVALPKGFVGGGRLIASQYPNAVTVSLENDDECIEAIASGEADIMFQDIYVADRQIQSPRYERLTIFPVYQLKREMKLVMVDTDDGLLLSVLDKSIDAIRGEELDNIVLMHTVADPYQYTLRDTFYKYRVPLCVIAALLTLVAALFVFIIIVDRRHSKRLMVKNKELKDALDKVEHSEKMLCQAERDALTGLYNRDAFFAKVAEMVAEHESGYYVLACFDIYNFKVINDQYGNEKGDEALKRIARIFDNVFLPMGGICCRVSADDFVALYPHSHTTSDTLINMRDEISSLDVEMQSISFSIGRYIIDDLTLPVSSMYDRALLAQSAAKGSFDNNIVTYEESMRKQLLKEQGITSEMKNALETEQFEVWLQPQYNHATGALTGAESLVRWRRPKDGLLTAPEDFIPVFERNGFIYEMDKFVWKESCEYLRRWIDAGQSPPPLSVNVSRYDMLQEDIISTLTGLVEQYALPVEMLRIEITESAFSEDTDRVVGVTKELIEYGFTVEIDDFGSGYSSLNTLKDVPAQILKMDMRFIENSDGSGRGGNILESVVRMAKWLGMSVIAEGVETIEQADYLKSIGCVYVQGFLYARPMPLEEYEKLMQSACKEEQLPALQTVKNLNNNAFWNPTSMDALIFNSFVGAAAIVEYHDGSVELLRVSDKFIQTLGSQSMTTDDVLRQKWERYFDKDSFDAYRAAVSRSIETGDETTAECALVGVPGCPKKIYLRITVRVIAVAGERYLLYCLNENITAQKELEAVEVKAQEASERLQTVLDNIDSGVTAAEITDADAVYLFGNDRFFALHGYTRAQYEAEVRSPFELVHPDDRPMMIAELAEANNIGRNKSLEYRIIRRDGEVRWLRAVISVRSLTNVERPVLFTVYSDITERKNALEEINVSNTQLRFLNNTASKLLAQSDAEKAIDGILRDVLEYFKGKRVYVIENDDARQISVNTYEVCAPGVVSEKDNLQNVSYESAPFWFRAFEKDKFIYIPDVDTLDEGRAEEREILRMQGIRSLVAVPLVRDGKLIGFSGVDDPCQQLSGIEQLCAISDYIVTLLTRRDLNAKIAKDNDMLLTMMDDMPGGFARLRILPDGVVATEYVNDNFCRLRGMTREEIMTADRKDSMATIHPDDVAPVRRHVMEMAATGETRRIKYRLRHADGSYMPVSVFCRVTVGDDGAQHINVYYADLSEQEKKEITIRETVPFILSAILASSTDLAFAKDNQFRYICASPEMVKMTSCEHAEDVIGKTDYELFDKEIADGFRREDMELFETNRPLINHVNAVPSSEGTIRFFKFSKFILRDTFGNTLGLYCIGRDITEEKDTFSRLKLLVDSIPGGMASYIASPSGIRNTYFNDGYCKMFGYTRAEYEKMAARSITSVAFAEDVPRLMERVQALIKDGRPLDFTYRIHTKDGGYKWVNMRGYVAERHGDISLLNGVLYDLTERVEAENALRMSEEQFRIAVEISGKAVARYDIKTGAYQHTSKYLLGKGFERRLENMPQTIIDAGLISPDCMSEYLAFYDKLRQGVSPCSVDIAVPEEDGVWRWFRGDAKIMTDADGKPAQAIIVYSDITELREKEAVYRKWRQSLIQRPEKAYTLFRCNLSKDSSFDSLEGKLLWVEFSSSTASFNERTREYVNQCVYESDRAEYLAFLNSDVLLANYYRGVRMKAHEYREVMPDGTIRWLHLTVELVEYLNSSDVEAFLLYEDIDEEKRDELRTRELAQTDPLTGVLNRASFSQAVDRIIAEPTLARSLAILMLDIDFFKQVNDTLGHDMGDRVLKDTADTLRSVLRHGDLLGRLGGDEFLVCMRDVYDDESVKKKAEQICSLLHRSLRLDVHTSASIGIAVCPRDGKDFVTLYRRADTALYKVKAQGKNGFAFFEESMLDAPERRN